ncbi:MAG: hypothetical protein ACYCYF_13140, partial [Anaerolineae bacterium]
RDWRGQIRPAGHGAWRQRLDSGEVITHANPRGTIRRKEQAVQRFFDAAFPAVRVTTHHLLLLTDPSAQVSMHGAADPPVVELANLRAEMDSLMLAARGDRMDESIRGALVEALGSRSYETFEMANDPFIFRSGGFFGFGKRARTIQQVVRHMELRPQDGIYHLWNGSLARWFRDQGATHLADLASQAIKRPESERIALETFLQESGLVDRPRVVLRPEKLNFGYVGIGERTAMIWRIRKGRGRGYLSGTAISRSPWLQVDPGVFEKQLDATVTVDTEAIPITERPARGHIDLQTNATAQPLDVEARVNVRSMPSPFEVRIVRPLLGLALGGIIGYAIGVALHALGLDAGLAARLPDLPVISAAQVLPVLIGLIWAVLGAVRGWMQRWAWPTWYAVARWLVRTAAWMAGLAALAIVAFALARWLFPALGAYVTPDWTQRAALIGAALGVIPASVGEIRVARHQGVRNQIAHPVRRYAGRVAWAALGVALLMLVVGGVRFFAQDFTLKETAAEGRGKLETWMDAREIDLLELRDRVLIRYSDRRATPIPTSSVTPRATATPRVSATPTGTPVVSP